MWRDNRGIVLIISFLVIVVLTTLGSAFLLRSVSENNIAQRSLNSLKAFWISEAGVHRALKALNDSDWTGWEEPESNTRTITESFGEGSYSITVTNLGSKPIIESTGNVGGIQRVIEVKVKKPSPFTFGAFGESSLEMSGNGKTDSYNSTQGAYGGSNVGTNGDIGTNGTSTGAISLSGNAIVNGDASTGSGGTVQISGNASVTGEITNTNNQSLPQIVIPTDLINLTNSGNYTISGNNSDTLSSGDYKFDPFNVSGNARLNISGAVRIYLTNSNSSLDISGNGQLIILDGASLEIYADGKSNISGNGIVNQTSLPKNLILNSTYSGFGEGIKISGNADFYGAIYAPDAEVKNSGNGSIFGAVVGKEVKISGNGNLHYDESLKTLEGPFSQYTFEAWREKSSL